jgi:A/G-specific adenine glycosylase
VALVRNDYAPFLKGHWIWPGRAERLSRPPARFDYRATVTHHDIFVELDGDLAATKVSWVPRADLAKWVPASLVAKAIAIAEKRRADDPTGSAK